MSDVIGLLTRIYELERRLATIEQALGEIRAEIAELREAKKAIEKYSVRSVYRLYGKRLLIEVAPSRIAESIDEEIELLEVKAARLESEKKRVEEELGKLRSLVPGGARY